MMVVVAVVVLPRLAEKSTELNTLLEKFIDSVLLMNNKLEGLSNRVNALEQNEDGLGETEGSQEQEQTVFVGSHLVSKLSSLQKLVENELPVAVDIASSSKGLDVLQEHPNSESVTKINVGVAFSLNETSAYGRCLRVILGYSPVEAEARAYLDGLEFAVKNELDNVVIEGDAQNISEILNIAGHLVPGRIRPDILRIRELASSIPSIEFRFIKESANLVAHTLASYAKSKSISRSWLSSPPPIISTSLLDWSADENWESDCGGWITDENWDSE
ncbi:hypothetical protein MKW92_000521 [Papaver armeniacum]|nr:hypothetical protein MKW92_000521 [Papaver armeniacum]